MWNYFTGPGIFLPKTLTLKKSNLIADIPYIGKEYRVSFDVVLESQIITQDFVSILHITTGEDDSNVGSRIPGVWLTKDKTLLISSTLNGNYNYVVNTDDPLPEGQWTTVEILQVLHKGWVIFN